VNGASLDLDKLRAWVGDKLSPYKLPQDFRTVSSLPRNRMGWVTKPAVKKTFKKKTRSEYYLVLKMVL